MKVAFCSNDGVYVNEHFGQAETIYIYEVNENGYEYIETRKCYKSDPRIDHLDFIDKKIEQISDCKIVYFTQIGGPAAAKVIKSKIFPVKVKEDETIEGIISSMIDKFSNPPLWLRKILHEES